MWQWSVAYCLRTVEIARGQSGYVMALAIGDDYIHHYRHGFRSQERSRLRRRVWGVHQRFHRRVPNRRRHGPQGCRVFFQRLSSFLCRLRFASLTLERELETARKLEPTGSKHHRVFRRFPSELRVWRKRIGNTAADPAPAQIGMPGIEVERFETQAE